MHPVEKIPALADVWDEFTGRAHGMVWANLATLDRQGRPRSRVVHPIWDGLLGWVGTLGSTPKVREIRHNPHVSVAYIADVAKPVYADCLATWVEDPAERERIWTLFRSTPPPLGYDPAEAFGTFDPADLGIIKLEPYRVEVTNWPTGTRVWREVSGER